MAAIYSRISTADTNAQAIKAGLGNVCGWFIMNISASTYYIRLYDKATAPVPASDVPKIRLALPAGEGSNISFAGGHPYFQNGIAIDITKGAGDTDTTAAVAGDVLFNLFYD